jgi:hypothetical protein
MKYLRGRMVFWAALAAVLLTAGMAAAADDATAKPETKPAETAKPARPQLKPELAALRDQVRRTLAAQQQQPFNTQQNSPTEVQSLGLAFGCNSQVAYGGPDGQRVSAIACLCWNYPCAGFQPLVFSQRHIAARIGYGGQEHPGEFLAMLAMARVPVGYSARIGRDVRKLSDLVEAEQLGCRDGDDLSLKLIGLSYYVTEPEWKNDLDETWSIGRMIDEELERPADAASEAGVNRLLGLGYAVARQAKRGEPLEKPFRRAQKYIGDFHSFALRLQNADGSWGPYFLAARGASDDAATQLRSTGRVLEWLAVSLPDDKLTDPHVVAAVDYVSRLVGSQRYQWNVPAFSTREIVAWGHALHALAVYDQRVFKPFDEAPAKPAAPATARRY